jgi:hypothetical protein
MELSAEQIRDKLSDLLNAGDSWRYWIRDLYDDHVVYQDDTEHRLYTRDYTVDGADVSFTSEPREVIPAYDEVEPQASEDGAPAEEVELPTLTDAATLARLASRFKDAPIQLRVPVAEDKEKRVLMLDASTIDLEQSNEAWVHVTTLGEWYHDEYGLLNFDEAMFESWKKNLEAGVWGGTGTDGKPRIAIDYSHAMDEAPPEQHKAAGYIDALKLEGDEVYAHIEFTKPAAEAIKNGEWSWFSISAVDSLTSQATGEDVGNTLIGGALTNRPFIPGLKPIQLSQLKPTAANKLKKELAQHKRELEEFRQHKRQTESTACLSALKDAGIPPAVIRMLEPLYAADSQAVTLTVKVGKDEVSFARHVTNALLELARSGKVPEGEKSDNPSPKLISLSEAVEELTQVVKAEAEAKGNKSLREADIYKEAALRARRKYPHLKESENGS